MKNSRNLDVHTHDAACNPRGVTYGQRAYWQSRLDDAGGRLAEVEALVASIRIVAHNTAAADTVSVLVDVLGEKFAALRQELFREEEKRTR